MIRRVMTIAAVLIGTLIPATSATAATTIIVADATTKAFAIRLQYDEGGSTPLGFFLGYSESSIATPEPQADGQGSWYNFGIAETAAFKAPAQCTPEKNAQATRDGAADAQTWIGETLADSLGALGAGRAPPAPTIPSIRHACSERLPGFAQSRYPASASCDDDGCGGIPQRASDDLITKPACKTPACDSAGSVPRDRLAPGSFESVSGPEPSNSSSASIAGAGDAATVWIGSITTRTEASSSRATAETVLHDVCVMPSAGACGVSIRTFRQIASVTGTRAESHTEVSGLVVNGSAVSLDDKTLPLSLVHCCYEATEGEFLVDAVAQTKECTPVQAAARYRIADAGGLRIFGKSGQGGGITIGGACARLRVTLATVSEGVAPADDFTPGTPSRTILLGTKTPAVGTPVAVAAPARFGPPRIVTHTSVRYVGRASPLSRTAGIWARLLAALLVMLHAAWIFRESRFVQPAARGLDRFARRFLYG